MRRIYIEKFIASPMVPKLVALIERVVSIVELYCIKRLVLIFALCGLLLQDSLYINHHLFSYLRHISSWQNVKVIFQGTCFDDILVFHAVQMLAKYNIVFYCGILYPGLLWNISCASLKHVTILNYFFLKNQYINVNKANIKTEAPHSRALVEKWS